MFHFILLVWWRIGLCSEQNNGREESYDEAEVVLNCKELSERLSRSPKHLDALHRSADSEFLGVSTQLRWAVNRIIHVEITARCFGEQPTRVVLTWKERKN